MSTTSLAALGIASGVVNILGLAPYVRDIFKGKTKPERATWWIWGTLSAIAFLAQLAAGARWSLYMTGGQMLVAFAIAIASVWYGYGTFHKRDIVSLLVAALGLLAWKFTHDPLAALLIVVFVDALAFWLTISKTWQAPHTETLISWVIAGIAGVMGVWSVGEWNLTKMIYPMYIMLANWLLVLIIIIRRPRVKA